MPADARISTPPNRVREKARKTARSLDAVLDRADAAVMRMAPAFDADLKHHTRDLAAAAAEARADAAGRAGHLAAVRDTAHEIRGLGSTFGYQLLTEIAGSLFELLDEGREATTDDRGLAVVDLHVAALRRVIENGTHGEGDAIARSLLDGLHMARRRIIS